MSGNFWQWVNAQQNLGAGHDGANRDWRRTAEAETLNNCDSVCAALLKLKMPLQLNSLKLQYTKILQILPFPTLTSMRQNHASFLFNKLLNVEVREKCFFYRLKKKSSWMLENAWQQSSFVALVDGWKVFTRETQWVTSPTDWQYCATCVLNLVM